MNHRHALILLCIAAGSAAAAATEPARTDSGGREKPVRTLAGIRPNPAATVVSAVLSANSLPEGGPGLPLDRSPLPASRPLPAGAPQPIAGECFVITGEGLRIKLAQVEISVYPEREFNWYAQAVTSRSKARFDGIKSIALPANFSDLSVTDMDRSLAAAANLQQDLHDVWQILPAAETSTKTDRDGHFSLTHRVEPPYVILALGRRNFGPATEYYQWQISSNVITDPQHVVLNNDNLR